MKNLTGCISRRTQLVRVAGTTALAAALLVVLPLVSPAAAADYYGYGEPRYAAPAYPPAVQYEERYEYRAPAYPRYGYEQPPVEYRVLVYPPRPRYYQQSYEYGPPPYATYDNGRRPVRVVRPEGYAVYPADPYRPQYVAEPLLPPAYVGRPRW